MWNWLRRRLGSPATPPPPAPTTLPTDLLVGRLADPSPERRRLAEEALRHDPGSACPALTAALRTHPSPAVQKAALGLLTELGGPEAADAVVTAFDRDPPLRAACFQALAALLRRHGPEVAGRLRPLLDDPAPERQYLRNQVRALFEQVGPGPAGA